MGDEVLMEIPIFLKDVDGLLMPCHQWDPEARRCIIEFMEDSTIRVNGILLRGEANEDNTL